MDGCLAGVQVLAVEFQRADQLFVQSALFAADIEESLRPMIGRWLGAVLCADGQGPNDYVTQIAFVGVVAVDAQATPA